MREIVFRAPSIPTNLKVICHRMDTPSSFRNWTGRLGTGVHLHKTGEHLSPWVLQAKLTSAVNSPSGLNPGRHTFSRSASRPFPAQISLSPFIPRGGVGEHQPQSHWVSFLRPRVPAPVRVLTYEPGPNPQPTKCSCQACGSSASMLPILHRERQRPGHVNGLVHDHRAGSGAQLDPSSEI